MKLKFTFIAILSLMFVSCNRNIYGIYNSNHSTDKSAFFQIKLDSNHTVEKNEIHTIRIDSKGTWKEEDGKVICYFDSTETGFPPDTLILKIIGKKMFFERKGIVYSKSLYLKKVN